MNLVDFLGWEDSNGIYRSEVDGEFYRVVDNMLEIYDPDLLEWEDCDMPINEYSKLQTVEEVGVWREGFAIHNKERWELVKGYFLQNGYEISDSLSLIANIYLKEDIVFYVYQYYGHVQITTDTQVAKRDLILEPIKCPLKFYAEYIGRADFGEKMYWRINSDGSTVSLLREKAIVNWHDAGILNTLKGWERCGITTKNAVFTTAGRGRTA